MDRRVVLVGGVGVALVGGVFVLKKRGASKSAAPSTSPNVTPSTYPYYPMYDEADLGSSGGFGGGGSSPYIPPAGSTLPSSSSYTAARTGVMSPPLSSLDIAKTGTPTGSTTPVRIF